MRLVRGSLAIGLCPALLLALQQAPLLHIHEKGHATEHVAAQHAHALGAHSHPLSHSERSHNNETSEIEAVDEAESAVTISFFHSKAAKTSVEYLAVRTFPVVETVVRYAVRVSSERPRIHDPPFRSSLIPRAPPA